MAKRKVTIKRDNLKTYIFRMIGKQARWTEADLKRLKLIKS
jgi:hypothetical protein